MFLKIDPGFLENLQSTTTVVHTRSVLCTKARVTGADNHTQAIEVSANLHNKVSKGMVSFPVVTRLGSCTAVAAKVAERYVNSTSHQGASESTRKRPNRRADSWYVMKLYIMCSIRLLKLWGILIIKTGKQAVYHALQDAAQNVTPEIIAAINQDIGKLQAELSDLKTNDKKARMVLAAFEASPCLSALEADVLCLEGQRQDLQARLATLHGPDSLQLSQVERERLEREWHYWQSHAITRRRIGRDLWGKWAETLPPEISEQELWVRTISHSWKLPRAEDGLQESLGLEGTLQ